MRGAYNWRFMTPAIIEQLAQRVERLLLRHDELLRTQALLQAEVARLTHERDQLLAQCHSARQKLDALIDRLNANAENAP